MAFKIFDKSNTLRTILHEGDNSSQQVGVKEDDVISISMTAYECVRLEPGDWLEFLGLKYWLVEAYTPKEISTVEWQYEVKFYGPQSIIKNALMLSSENVPLQAYTAPAREQLAMVVKNLNRWMGTTDWKVGDCISTENLVIDYSGGTYANEALDKISDETGCEWWMEGTTVNLTRCEHDEPIELEYGNGLLNIEPDTADNVKFFTRLFPVGSTRNIDPGKYGHSRLQLPDGIQYVEKNTENFGIFEHYEEEAFANIFPRRTGHVSSVSEEQTTDGDGNSFVIYYFTDDSLNFDPNNYEIGGLVKHVIFQDGELAGRDFEVNFDSGKKRFEIITTWPFDDDTQLPGGKLIPKVGNAYILYNIRMPDEYYPQAQEEYKLAVDKFLEDHSELTDRSVFKCRTDYINLDKRKVILTIGQRVKLISSRYFPKTGYRLSRITRITRNLQRPNQADIEISDVLSKTSMSKMEGNIESIRNEVHTATTTFPDIVRTGDNTLPTDNNVFSAKRSQKEFLSKRKDDTAAGHITFEKGIDLGNYKEGKSGGKIDKDGNAEFGSLITRLKAILAELQVNGPAEFRDHLSSEDFISGFLGGKGWSIYKKEALNALGVSETKYTGEFDEVIVRGALRVFTMVISQLLGENDNRVFTGMMEVDHYDPSTGKVYLKTQEGKLYNPFRKDDYIMVQQYNGMPSDENDHYVTKHYELIITGAGIGSQSDGENRLDWVTFSNFVSADGRTAADAISKGDTFTRVDNATDADRKGIIQIITVGAATPYMDIVYGLKTDPDNYLKGRLGNLQGIHHHLFGWLQGFGELLTNLYAVGDMRLRRTGESLDAKIEALKAMFATQYQRVTYEITEDDNYLKNAAFTESLEHWQYENETQIITTNGEALLMNGSTFNATGKMAVIEEYEGRNMLHIKDSSIKQLNKDIKKPGTHKEFVPPELNNLSGEYVEVKDILYLSLKFLAKTSGTLTFGMQGATSESGSLPLSQIAVTNSMDWQTIQVSGTWDGKGDFVLKYTGDMYVSILSLTDKALDDFKKEVSTRIEQTDSNIRLLGTNVNNLKGTVTQLGIDLDAAEESISIYANKTNQIDKTVTSLGIRLDAAESNISLYAQRIANNESSISALQIKTDSITSTVASVQGDLAQAKKTAAAASQAAQDVADNAQERADSAWWAAYYAQQDADNAQATADSALAKSASNATAITQNKNSISAIAGLFDSEGHLLEGSGWVTTSSFNSLYSKVYDMDGKLAAKAELSTSVQYDPSTGRVTSAIKLTADKIDINGVTTINNSFSVESNGTTHLGGFVVSGNGLTNRNTNGTYTNDAYVIFRNDAHGCFAGIGGNVLPAISGSRGVARFENHDESDWWGLGANYAMIVSARGTNDNIAIAMEGGCISGLSVKTLTIGHDSITQSTQPTSKYVTIGRDIVDVYASTQFYWRAKSTDDYQSKTRNVYLTLPTMQPYDDGHEISIKRGSDNGSDVYLSPGTSYRRELVNGTWTTRSGSSYILYDNASYATSSNKLILDSEGDAMKLRYHRDLSVTVNGMKYYGCWVQYKHPRSW